MTSKLASFRDHIFLQNKALAGIWLYILANFLIVIASACAKLASEHHSPIEIVFYRSSIALFLLLGFIFVTKRKNVFKTKRPKAHFARSLIGTIGITLAFWSYSILPLADITALLFASPILATALSYPLLKEKVGFYRWCAVVIGFIGVLLISQPYGGTIFNLKTIVPMGAIIAVALVPICLRNLGKTEDPHTTTFYFLLMAVTLGTPYMILYGYMPNIESLLPIIGVGIAGFFSLTIKTYAFSLAEASLLNPFAYTSIVWATLFGWLIWGDIPTMWVIAGTFIIITSNLFIMRREKNAKAL